MQAMAMTEIWSIARFPSREQRQEFLDQVRIWNKVEGLPAIETLPLSDGVRLRFRSLDQRRHNVLRLIDAYGGLVPDGSHGEA